MEKGAKQCQGGGMATGCGVCVYVGGGMHGEYSADDGWRGDAGADDAAQTEGGEEKGEKRCRSC